LHGEKKLRTKNEEGLLKEVVGSTTHRREEIRDEPVRAGPGGEAREGTARRFMEKEKEGEQKKRKV